MLAIQSGKLCLFEAHGHPLKINTTNINTNTDGDENAVLLQLMQMRHSYVICFERHHIQVTIELMDESFYVSKDNVTSA